MASTRYLPTTRTAFSVLRFTERTPLVLIDLQKAINHPSWGVRNNPQAESNVALLIAAWRAQKRRVYHIRPIRSSRNRRTRSSVHTTRADVANGGSYDSGDCRSDHSDSVEATVRMAGDLGFETYLVLDACFTFARKDWNGHLR